MQLTKRTFGQHYAYIANTKWNPFEMHFLETHLISQRCWLSCCAPQLMPIYVDFLNVNAVASPVLIQLIYLS